MAPGPPLHLSVSLPDWIGDVVSQDAVMETDEERMALAIRLSQENIERGTGGPFGACVFERSSGRLVAVGVNCVQQHNNSTLHAEMTALMMAQQRVGHFTLRAPHLPVHELVSSCEPCAMCFGALLWSGVARIVCGASREDATALGFDEGPVFQESFEYLEERGLEFRRGLMRREAAAVLERYGREGGEVY